MSHKMTKNDLFKKYAINDSHNKWEIIDDRMSIDIYRLMHNGSLPSREDESVQWVTDFLDKKGSDIRWWVDNVLSLPHFGSLYITAKRMVYRFADQLCDNHDA